MLVAVGVEVHVAAVRRLVHSDEVRVAVGLLGVDWRAKSRNHHARVDLVLRIYLLVVLGIWSEKQVLKWKSLCESLKLTRNRPRPADALLDNVRGRNEALRYRTSSRTLPRRCFSDFTVHPLGAGVLKFSGKKPIQSNECCCDINSEESIYFREKRDGFEKLQKKVVSWDVSLKIEFASNAFWRDATKCGRVNVECEKLQFIDKNMKLCWRQGWQKLIFLKISFLKTFSAKKVKDSQVSMTSWNKKGHGRLSPACSHRNLLASKLSFIHALLIFRYCRNFEIAFQWSAQLFAREKAHKSFVLAFRTKQQTIRWKQKTWREAKVKPFLAEAFQYVF